MSNWYKKISMIMTKKVASPVMEPPVMDSPEEGFQSNIEEPQINQEEVVQIADCECLKTITKTQFDSMHEQIKNVVEKKGSLHLKLKIRSLNREGLVTEVLVKGELLVEDFRDKEKFSDGIEKYIKWDWLQENSVGERQYASEEIQSMIEERNTEKKLTKQLGRPPTSEEIQSMIEERNTEKKLTKQLGRPPTNEEIKFEIEQMKKLKSIVKKKRTPEYYRNQFRPSIANNDTDWYREAALFGTDPFGASEISQKTQSSPFGHAGGDEHNGVFSPSGDGTLHHPNDCFSESNGGGSLEKRMQDKKDKKKKKKKKAGSCDWYKTAQFGSGSQWPHFNTPPNGKSSIDKQDWVTQTFEEITGNDEKAAPAHDSSQQISPQDIIKSMAKTTFTVSSFLGQDGESGSGFFFDANKILTCFHVVNVNGKPAESISIKINEEKYNCNFVFGDSDTDMAVLEVEGYESLDVLDLGDSDSIELGDDILVYGSPLGFENVVQQGIVSSQPVAYQEKDKSQDLIFVSANIVSGNSGGPVVSVKDNKVISIASCSIKLDENSGSLSASIPINNVKMLLGNNNLLPKTANVLYDLYKAAFVDNEKNEIYCDFKLKFQKYSMIKESIGSHDPEKIEDVHKILKNLERFIGVDGNLSMDDVGIFLHPLSLGAKRVTLRQYKLIGLVKKMYSLSREYKREMSDNNHNILRAIRKDFMQCLKDIKNRIKDVAP